MRPTELLKQDHRTIEVLLDRLVDSAFDAARCGSPDLALLYRLIHVLLVLLDAWHRQKEEGYFFPLVLQRGVTVDTVRIALLEEAHDTLGGDVRALKDVMDRACGNPSLWTTVSFRAVDLANRVRSHIQREERLFPLAEASLIESDRSALVLAFSQVELLDPYPGVREEIHRLVGEHLAGGAVVGGIAAGTSRASTWDGRDPVLARSCA